VLLEQAREEAVDRRRRAGDALEVHAIFADGELGDEAAVISLG